MASQYILLYFFNKKARKAKTPMRAVEASGAWRTAILAVTRSHRLLAQFPFSSKEEVKFYAFFTGAQVKFKKYFHVTSLSAENSDYSSTPTRDRGCHGQRGAGAPPVPIVSRRPTISFGILNLSHSIDGCHPPFGRKN
ncbi:MAG: hypothetical protein LBK71_11940 [Verrucomicrobiales bacterium]|nr:hypothetical protein [Verrucomicrobiales bacterium]